MLADLNAKSGILISNFVCFGIRHKEWDLDERIMVTVLFTQFTDNGDQKDYDASISIANASINTFEHKKLA